MLQKQDLSEVSLNHTFLLICFTMFCFSPLVNGMYLGGAQTVFPVSQQAASNIMFPVTYVNPRTQPISQPVEKATNLTPNVVRAVPILAATVINPNGKSKSVQIKQGNVRSVMKFYYIKKF